MPDCLFCKIVEGKTPATIVYQDEQLVAFKDIDPQAPTHILIIPRRHISTLNDLAPNDDGMVGEMIRRASLTAKKLGCADAGYRIIFNCNRSAGQSVFHIHLHLLAGRVMAWPPG